MSDDTASKRAKKYLPKVGRHEIAKGVSHVEGLSMTQAERVVDLVFKNIKFLMIERYLIEIPGFGRFYAKYVGPRKGSHPQTHEHIQINSRVQARAEFSSSLKETLNQHRDEFSGLLGSSKEQNGQEESQ